MEAMYEYGSSSEVDLQQARSLVATAAAAVPQYERSVVQTEATLCSLIGENLHSIYFDARTLLSSDLIPMGLPSHFPSSLFDLLSYSL